MTRHEGGVCSEPQDGATENFPFGNWRADQMSDCVNSTKDQSSIPTAQSLHNSVKP